MPFLFFYDRLLCKLLACAPTEKVNFLSLTETVNAVRTRSGTTHAYVAIFVGLIAASFAANFVRLSQEDGVPSLVIAAGRLGLAWLILTPLVVYRYQEQLRQINRRDLLLTGLAGLWIGIHLTLMAVSLEHTKVLISQVFINTMPLWVALLERFFLRAKLAKIVWAGLVLALLGSSVIAFSGLTQSDDTASSSAQPATTVETSEAERHDNTLLGGFLALSGALAGSVYMTIGRSVRGKVTLIPYVWMVFGGGGLTGLVFVFATRTPITGHEPMGYFWLLMLTLLPQLVGHSSMNYALAYIPAALVSLSTQAVTVISTIIAFFLFAEVPSEYDIVGSAIIAAGVSLAIWGQRNGRPSN